MFIINPEKVKKKIKVSKEVGEELINKYKIPILNKNENDYYFANTRKIKKILKGKSKK